MKIIFATANAGKLREAAEVLGPGFEIVSPASMGITEDIPETGSTLQENSLQKARYLFERTGLPCFADDTGLEVDALGGAPGIYSARYAGPGHDHQKNMEKLLAELEKLEIPDQVRNDERSRRARFRTVVTLILADGEPRFFEGVCEGSIAREKRGTGGFGYDPVFLPDAYPGRTLAEVSEEEKNAVSHRGRAIRAMAAWLKSR
ncbi:MAG: RdgB/HAM1 family non-canonical purine NTP pyrophosphatase [Bacteroidales bacterium]|nr:RdgB/HAM1 family non-canonical purine NTP pyrophosphatase [Bacteroidales bacterium]